VAKALTPDFFFERHPGKAAGIAFELESILYSGQSDYQKVDILQTKKYGRVMLLDEVIMLTSFDEFVYHEMITHVPLSVHPNPRQVLTIGGGDGGTLREVVKHPSVERAVLAEIDQKVLDVSREYFPEIASGLDHPKSELQIGDALDYIQDQENQFDVILSDSTDPIGPAVGLFEQPFYRNVYNALTTNGIFVAQSESPFWDPEIVKSIHENLTAIFPVVRFYTAFIPTYPSGMWSFVFASKGLDPLKNMRHDATATFQESLKYYAPDVHHAAFTLPQFFKNLIR